MRNLSALRWVCLLWLAGPAPARAAPPPRPPAQCGAHLRIYDGWIAGPAPGGATLKGDLQQLAAASDPACTAATQGILRGLAESLLSWQDRLDGGARPPRRPRPGDERGDPFAPLPIPEEQARLLAAMEGYVATARAGTYGYAQDGPLWPELAYRRAQILYRHGHVAQAAPAFAEVVERSPDRDLAGFAARLHLDCLAVQIQGEPAARDQLEAQLAATVERYLQRPALLRDAEFARHLQLFRHGLFRRQVERLLAAGEYGRAAEGYLQLLAMGPKDPRADEVLYNAAICLLRARRLPEAREALARLCRDYPTSPLARRALLQLASGHRALGDYDLAARSYEDFARRYPGDPGAGQGEIDAPDALLTAVVLRASLGQMDRARADVDLLVKNYGRRPDLLPRVGEALLWLGQLELDPGAADRKRRQTYLRDHLRLLGPRAGADQHLFVQVALGEIAWRAACPDAPADDEDDGDEALCRKARDPALAKEAAAHFTRALALYRGGAAAAHAASRPLDSAALHNAAARAMRCQADARFEALLAHPPGGAAFAAAMAEARGGYEAILRLPEPRDPRHAVAALGRLGELAAAFAGSPLAAASRMEEAEAALVRCLEAAAAHVVPAWSARCAREAHRLAPARHRLPLEERPLEFPYSSALVLDRAPILAAP